MTKKEASVLGANEAKKVHLKNMQNRILKYNITPKKCLQCNSNIPYNKRQNMFCNHLCRAVFNNKKRTKKHLNKCIVCNIETHNKKYCSIKCSSMVRIKKSTDMSIDNITKGELFSSYKNYQSARSAIRKHATKVYNVSNKPKECKKCGYNKHYEVCHIKSVKDFNKNVKINIINHIDNLIALCPNHHWEYDNENKHL